MSENGGTPDYKVAQMDACEILDFSVIIKYVNYKQHGISWREA